MKQIKYDAKTHHEALGENEYMIAVWTYPANAPEICIKTKTYHKHLSIKRGVLS